MALRPVQVKIKAVDDAEVGRFRAEALGWEISSEAPGVTNVEPGGDFVRPGERAVRIEVVTVPEARTATRNRAHGDLAVLSPR